MSDTPIFLLAKLIDETGSSVSEAEILVIAQYLGVDINLHPAGGLLETLKEEVSRQNAFLSTKIGDDDVTRSNMYKKSNFVREIVDRRNGKREVGAQKSKVASLEEVESALLRLCDFMEYPLYVANATENKIVIRFVAELAAEVFGRVQVKFKELETQLQDEASGQRPQHGDQRCK